MWRRTSLVVAFAFVAATAAAQTRPATPAPPAPPAPPALPAPWVVAPAPLVLPNPLLDLDLLDMQLDALRGVDFPAIGQALGALNLGVDAQALFDAQKLERLAERQATAVARGQNLIVISSETAEYDRGTSYLDSGRYDRAVESFDKVIAKGGPKAEGAMYWKAYALDRLGRRDEAIKTLDEQLKKYPSGRWANDSKALLIDVRQAAGRPVSPDATNDEELKLIALNSIVQRDPDRGIPAVEQILSGSSSPRLKEKALFVLAQSGSPRAKALLVEFAKGKGNPDLQLKALDYLGVFAGGPDVPLLVEVYKGTSDIDVKKRVIRSLSMTRRITPGAYLTYADSLASYAVSTEQMKAQMERARADIERAREAMVRAGTATATAPVVVAPAAPPPPPAPAPPTPPVQNFKATRSADSAERDKAREAKAKEASDALWTLYQGEQSVELKREILRNMRFTDQSDRLAQLARTESNPELRLAALQGLMWDRNQKTTDLMLGFYRTEKDPAVKRQIIDSIQGPGAAAGLVQLARQESDPALRKRIVERLSHMTDKEATDYMMEILKK